MFFAQPALQFMLRTFRRTVQFLLIPVLAALGTWEAASGQTDPGIRDTLRIDSLVTYVGGSGIVPINFSNDQPLAAIEVTLRENSSFVSIDSISFSGGRVEGLSLKLTKRSIDGAIDVYVSDLGAATIPAGSGLLGRIFCHWTTPMDPHVVMFDTTTFHSPGEFSTYFYAVNAPEGHRPIFAPGYLDIKATPDAFDSVWVADVEGDQGLDAQVEIGLYNERAVDNFAVALQFGSSKLEVDSVVFNPSRVQFAQTQVNPRESDSSVLITVNFDDVAPLSPGTGPIATMFLRVAADAPLTTIPIDSFTFATGWNTFITLTQADGGGRFSPFFNDGSVTVRIPTGIGDDEPDLPTDFALEQNYPNPFNPATTISFALPQTGHVSLNVMNILGQTVRELVTEKLSAGVHQVEFDGRDANGRTLPSGVYFYRLVSGNFSQTRKMLFVK